ncbi:META domain-containing protein [Tateyamaria sp. SN6-1]|uniref:META domain-containing protein n=1 Tax=Tateyamaria sp. SN6-1 TaxID=3092148 RepID=UPI0039F4DB33
MIRQCILAAAIVAAAACKSTAAGSGYGGPDTVWRLTTIDGAPAQAKTTLTFPNPGRIAGRAPCNSYFGPLNGTFPRFDAPAIASTRRACPDRSLESRYFAALRAAKSATRNGDTLILSDGSGRQRAVFKRAE